MKKLVILGAGGLAREVLWAARDRNQMSAEWEVLGFVDDNPETHGQMLCGLPVLGGFEWMQRNASGNWYGICGIGAPRMRKVIHERYASQGLRFATLIHPSVQMSRYVDAGPGVFIGAGNILTTQITLREHVFLNLACTVGHDAVFEPYVNCAPGCNISGGVHLRMGVHVGTGAKILQDLSVGEWTRIGAGAVVTKSLPARVVAVGVPAKPIKAVDL